MDTSRFLKESKCEGELEHHDQEGDHESGV